MSPRLPKAIRLPSRESAGPSSYTVAGLREWRRLPLAFMTQIWVLPPTPLALEKTILPVGAGAADPPATQTAATARTTETLVTKFILRRGC